VFCRPDLDVHTSLSKQVELLRPLLRSVVGSSILVCAASLAVVSISACKWVRSSVAFAPLPSGIAGLQGRLNRAFLLTQQIELVSGAVAFPGQLVEPEGLGQVGLQLDVLFEQSLITLTLLLLLVCYLGQLFLPVDALTIEFQPHGTSSHSLAAI